MCRSGRKAAHRDSLGVPSGKRPLPQNSQHVLTMLGASAAARHCFPSPAEATPVTSLLDRGQRTEGAHEEPRCHNAGPPREPAPTATGLWALRLVAGCLGTAVCAATPEPSAPQPEHVPLPGKAPSARTRKSETNSCPQASLLSRGNGSINNFFSPKVG